MLKHVWQESKLATNVQFEEPPPARFACAARATASRSTLATPESVALDMGESGRPLGRAVRRSTPDTQPGEGDDGHGGRDGARV